MPLTGEQLVTRYFRCVKNKDLVNTLELFHYDAVVYEPFSKVHALHGRSAIGPFLKVALMANSNVHQTVKVQKAKTSRNRQDANNNYDNNKIIALVTFEKGERIKGKFTFEFSDNELKQKKIKSLRIEFL